ncbi:MAG: ankyrin repeat domain-containing protein [Bryobacteraceae bacterium]
MPTELPDNPNLEHLKKQAKALLDDFRQNQPQAVERFKTLRLKEAPKLSDAQHLIAREYGFDKWSQLKDHVESLAAPTLEVMHEARRAFKADDAAALRELLERYPMLKTKINEPVADFDSPLINHVRSKAMLDVLLDAGADINARSRWWAGGFGLLDCASHDLAAHAIKRGAVVTVHAASRLGMLDNLKELIVADPTVVHARGGDGQTPLHFASTIEIAEYLLDHGANIDARDVDHESTPAQYMVRSRPEIARYLVRRGCKTDILMATALGDIDLIRKHLDADPECIRMRVSEEYFPMVGSGAGGTIYQWELGWHVSACQVARSFGHPEIFDLLMERSPAEEKLLNACWLHDDAMVTSLLDQNPNLAASLPPAGRRQLAHAGRNNDTSAARLMLVAGLPVDAFGQHHATPLHWAAWHGNAELVRLILRHNPPIENADNEFKGTPLRWAIHGSENGWHRKTGDYASTVGALLDAGASRPEKVEGTEAVKAVLQRRGMQ